MKNKILLLLGFCFILVQLQAQDLNYTKYNQPSEAEYSLKEHNQLMKQASEKYVKKVKKGQAFNLSLVPSFAIPGYTAYALRKVEDPFESGAKKTNQTFGVGALLSLVAIRTSFKLKQKEKEYRYGEMTFYEEALSSKNKGLAYREGSFNSANSNTGSSIYGIITDQSGESLIGASVILNGTNRGAVTDIEGKFTIADRGNASSITVSYIGYKTETHAIGLGKDLKIVLKEGGSRSFGYSRGWLSASVSAGVPLVNFSNKKVSGPANIKYGKSKVFYPSNIRENHSFGAKVGIRFGSKMGLKFNLDYDNFETQYTQKSADSPNSSYSITDFTGLPIVDNIYQINEQFRLKGGYYFKTSLTSELQLSALLSHRSVRTYEENGDGRRSKYLFYDLGQMYGVALDLNFYKIKFSLGHSFKNQASTKYRFTDFNMRWYKYFRSRFSLYLDFRTEIDHLKIGPSKIKNLTPQVGFGVQCRLF